MTLVEHLQRLARDGALDALDVELAALLARSVPAHGDEVALAAMLASRALGEGHVRIDLARLAARDAIAVDMAGPESATRGPMAPPLAAWKRALLASGAAVAPGGYAPLVLEGDHLYLQRYWRYEHELARDLLARGDAVAGIDDARLAAILARLFPAPEPGLDRQRLAAAVMATRRLAVISGGPGTGKTTTVVRALAARIELAGDAPLRIALAAPTGKAAARLQDVVRQARASLDAPPAVRDRLPAEAATVHRLLGTIPGRPDFRHGPGNPLPLDILVVDEASMLDLALAAKLLAALAPDTQLVLVGDRHQLASVEAGAVLASLCKEAAGFTRPYARRLAKLVGAEVPPAGKRAGALADAVVFLDRSWRFGGDSELGQLAQRVREGDADGAVELLRARRNEARAAPPDTASRVRWIETDARALVASLADRHAAWIAAARSASGPEAAFARLGTFAALTAHRRGPLGALGLSTAVEAELLARGRVPLRRDWYVGRPVMLTRNDYALRLFNGDVGVALAVEDGGVAAFFPSASGRPRRVAPQRVPEAETLYALTVHKSQGSEFDEVLIVLPETESRVLSRELLYTGITRARHAVTIVGGEAVLRVAIGRSVERESGLAERLARGGQPGLPRLMPSA
jgi:exodeoxyribonuclease V alpha subunit